MSTIDSIGLLVPFNAPCEKGYAAMSMGWCFFFAKTIEVALSRRIVNHFFVGVIDKRNVHALYSTDSACDDGLHWNSSETR